jgi:hypothetical protein
MNDFWAQMNANQRHREVVRQRRDNSLAAWLIDVFVDARESGVNILILRDGGLDTTEITFGSKRRSTWDRIGETLNVLKAEFPEVQVTQAKGRFRWLDFLFANDYILTLPKENR